MDYGFAAGGDAHHANLRAMFSRRPNTTLVHNRRVATLLDFIQHLDTTPSIPKPVGDLVVGTHAGSKGFLTMRLFRGQGTPSDFEAFDATLSPANTGVDIPDSLIGYSTGDPVTTNFHIKGCNVGRDRTDTSRTPAAPFLVKIKEALGDHVNVTAPKHFHGLSPASGEGMFEYMAYEFKLGVKPTRVARKLTGFADRDAALAAFRAGGFRYIDGTAIPNADWDPLIPQDITRTRDEQVTLTLGSTVGTRRTFTGRRQFRVEVDDVLWTLAFPSAGSIPPDRAGREAALRIDIPRDARFDPTHAFPQFERLGFRNFNDFFAGYLWEFGVSGRNLVCNGYRLLYTVLLAITDRATGNVMFNFYPDTGSATAAITNGLRETDARFFGRS